MALNIKSQIGGMRTSILVKAIEERMKNEGQDQSPCEHLGRSREKLRILKHTSTTVNTQKLL